MFVVIQLIYFALSVPVQSEAYSEKLARIEKAASGEEANRGVFLESISEMVQPAVEKVEIGNGLHLSALWTTVANSNAPRDLKLEGLRSIAREIDKVRTNAPRTAGLRSDPGWLMVYENIFSKTEIELLNVIGILGKFSGNYFALSIVNDEGIRATKWWYSLPERHRNFFINAVTSENWYIKGIQNAVNPSKVDPSQIDPSLRIPIVRNYLKHPFVQKAQPFNSRTFEQLMNFKLITADELFKAPELYVNLHFRQGLAWLDMARIYRKNKKFTEAMAAVNKGMTTRLQTKNRLASHAIEYVKIYIAAGNLKAARATLDSINTGHLDSYNEASYEELDAKLEEMEKED